MSGSKNKIMAKMDCILFAGIEFGYRYAEAVHNVFLFIDLLCEQQTNSSEYACASVIWDVTIMDNDFHYIDTNGNSKPIYILVMMFGLDVIL